MIKQRSSKILEEQFIESDVYLKNMLQHGMYNGKDKHWPEWFQGHGRYIKLIWYQGSRINQARDALYAEFEKIQYQGDTRNMFKTIQMHNDKAQLTGGGLSKLILDRLPERILGQMHTVDLTGNWDKEMIEIISKARRTAER